MRPAVHPGLRRFWRDEQTVQFGLETAHAVVVGGIGPAVAELLDRLDGTHELDDLVQAAAKRGVPAEEARRVLALLSAAGAMADTSARPDAIATLPLIERDRLGPDVAALSLSHPDPALALSRRRNASVRVVGAGRVGAPIATLLAAAAVGRVSVEDPRPVRAADAAPAGLTTQDAGRSRSSAVHARLATVSESVIVDPGSPVDVVVIADPPELDPTADLVRRGVPHLYASVRETTARVGPFVRPGRSACQRCLDLIRADRDPCWPFVAAQLSGPRRDPPAAEPCDVVLAHLCAGLAAREVLSHLDGVAPATLDGTLEIGPGAAIRRRSWRRHPACGCAEVNA
ncbi:MAG TPA: ThiF family adenylyltransferase [Mycobacteriales bacterium]|nr:ThiF family adenylyltransferase [Mycobacteriales bacterium]